MLEAQITGTNQGGKVNYNVSSNEIDSNFTQCQEDVGELDNVIERIWAYFTIRGLLEKKVLAETEVFSRTFSFKFIRLVHSMPASR